MEDLDQLYNFDEYDNPTLYDKEHSNYQRDLPLLMKWAKRQGGPVMDLACGTGRATIPLAREGYPITGVDVHQGMLDVAKQKTTSEDKITWILGDCSKLNLSIKVDFIFTVGNSFQHFLTNDAQDGLLDSVRRHLNEGGVFIFGTRFPNAYELLNEPEEEFEYSYEIEASGQMVDVYHLSRYDALEQVQYNTTKRKYRNQQGKIVKEDHAHITLRFVFPREMERLLERHGLTILHTYGNWEEDPLTATSHEMIYVCQK